MKARIAKKIARRYVIERKLPRRGLDKAMDIYYVRRFKQHPTHTWIAP